MHSAGWLEVDRDLLESGIGGEKIAALIPVLTTRALVAKVVGALEAASPSADIFVFLRSSDDTAAVVASSGRVGLHVVVLRQRLRRPPDVAEIDVDVHALADGDAHRRCGSGAAHDRATSRDKLDMVVVSRHDTKKRRYRRHRAGNRAVQQLRRAGVRHSRSTISLRMIRVLSAALSVKSFPLMFARLRSLRPEPTVHALDRPPVAEIETLTTRG